jgi:aromatic ring-cleaving dioxygenase
MKRFHVHWYSNGEDPIEFHTIERILSKSGLFHSVKVRKHPIGPHPLPMVEAQFLGKNLEEVLSFLARVRRGHSILVHEDTGNDERDHTQGAHWFGPKLALDFAFFRRIQQNPELKIHKDGPG